MDLRHFHRVSVLEFPPHCYCSSENSLYTSEAPQLVTACPQAAHLWGWHHQDSPSWLLGRAGKGSAASCTVTTPSAESVMWDIFQSNCSALGDSRTSSKPAELNAIHLLPLTSLCKTHSQHLRTCQILCDSCSSQVQQSCEFPSDITVVLLFWWSPASVALAGFDKWSSWFEEENRCFALFSSKQWCYFYRMTRQESKILPNLRILTCSSSSVRFFL